MKKEATKIIRATLLSILIGLFMVPASFAEAVIFDPGFQVETIASGFTLPTSMAFTPDGRIFVAEKGGAVKVVKNGAVLAEPLITLTDINAFGDRGLLGIATDPNFLTNGYVYLSYTFENTPGANFGGPKTARIVRFTVTGDTASEASKVVLVGTVGGNAATPSCDDFAITADCIPSNSSSHSAGGLRFGPDGKLYATLGDGANFDFVDPNSQKAQNLDALAGKMLRINTDGTAPADNPYFTGNANDNRSKVYALGLRNAFRFNFSPTGALYSGDVGWSTWEEVNVITAGGNYGWPCREGLVATSHNCTPSSNSTDPIYAYAHNSAGAGSITAGAFSTNGVYPAQYDTSFFIGDYAQNWIKRVVVNAANQFVSVQNFMDDPNGPVDISTGPDGNIYYLAIYTGDLMRITHTTGNRNPVTVMAANPTAGLLPLTVQFSSAGSSDPDGDPITFLWNFGDGTTDTAANPSHTYTVAGTYTAVLTVTDSHGSSATKSMTITAGNQKPSAHITDPASGSLYVAFQNIQLNGTGSDLEDGILPASAFHWEIILHHNTHIHHIQTFDGIKNPSFQAPDHNSADVYTEVVLTVTDSAGLTGTQSINLYLNNGNQSGNLITNPSVETEDPNTPALPLSWLNGWYGVLTPVFTYPAPGLDGAKSMKLQLTSYTQGSAKWFFSPVFVTPGQTYNFTSHYTATVPTIQFAQYGFADGTHTYVQMAALPASATDATVSYAITIPADVQTLTIFHELAAVGELTTDNFSLQLAGSGADTTPPNVGVTDPIAAETVSGQKVVQVTANDNVGVSGVNLVIDGVNILGDDTEAPYSFVWNTAGATNGAHTVSARARDAAGNFSTATPINVTVQNGVISTNLIQNPSLETAGVAGDPANWFRGGWGTNTAVFTYPSAPSQGAKGAKVDITAYTNGDAKWYFADAPVTAGHTYTISHDYKSNVATEVLARWTLAGGATQYQYLGAVPVSGVFALNSYTITAPANATSMTLFHVIHAVGSLEIDNFSLTDNAGGSGDTTLPTVSVTNPAAGATISGIVPVDATATDNVGVVGVSLLIDGAVVGTEDTTAPYSFTLNTTSLANGAHQISARARDAAGNIANATNVAVTVSNTGGSTNLISNPSMETDGGAGSPTNWLKGGWGTNTFTFTYPVTGLAGTKAAKIDITAYTDGDRKWYFTDVPVTPGTQYTFSHQYQSNTATEILARWTLAGGATQYQYLGALPASATTATTNYALTAPANAASVTVFHVLHSVGSLTVDNYSLTGPGSATSTGPAVSMLLPIAGTTIGGTINVTASSTGVAGVSLMVDGAVVGTEDTTSPYIFTYDTTGLSNGAHTFGARARTAANVTGDATPVSVTISNSATTSANLIANPNLETVNGTSPLNWTQNAWGNHTTVFAYPVIGYNGLKAARVEITAYPVNGDGDSKWVFDKVPVTPGTIYTYQDHYRSNTISDIIGQYTMNDGTFHYFGLQKEIQPSAEWKTVTNTFTPPVGATHVTLFHLISAVGFVEIDDAKLYASGTGVPSETNPPIVAFTNPLNGQTLSGTVAITASSTDDTAVTYVFYAIDGVPITGQLTTSPYLFNWDTHTVSDGVHALKATTHDPSGNNSTATISITVNNTNPPADTTAPTAIVTSPAAGTTLAGVTTVTATATDNVGVAGVTLLVDGAVSGVEDTTAPYSFSLNTGLYTNGAHTIAVRARDAANNLGTSAGVAITINNPTTSPNLVLNPSVETVGTGGNPANWNKGGWGTNNRVLTYPSIGPDGGNAMKIQITSYTDGDAKWYFDNVAVTPGSLYTFEDVYSSDTTTNITIRYTKTDGTFQYVGVINLPPTQIAEDGVTRDWSTFTYTFTPPAGVTSMTVMHILNSVGTLETDKYVLHTGAQAQYSKGMVSLTFDDGWLSQYTQAFPMLTAANMKASFYIISDQMANAVNGGPELIQNSTMETLAVSGDPDHWLRGGWGTNTRAYSVVAGDASANAARIDVTAYTNGDAKWYFENVPVTPGTQYIVKDRYNSNVATAVAVQYTSTTGVVSYAYLGSLPSTGGVWTSFQQTVTPPAGTASMTLFHVIAAVGNLTVDNYSLKLVSNPDNEYMDTAEVTALQNAGHEIGDHSKTHPDLTTLTTADKTTEIVGSRNALIAAGMTPVDTIAYPYGAYNAEVTSITKSNGYVAARTVDRGYNTPTSDKYGLKIQAVMRDTTMAEIQGWIDQAAANKVWLILMLHEVDTDPTHTFATSPSIMQATINYLAASNVDVVTLKQGLTHP